MDAIQKYWPPDALKRLEMFLDQHPNFGIKAVPSNDVQRMVDQKRGFVISDTVGQEWSKDRYYILDRQVSHGMDLWDSWHSNQLPDSTTIDGKEYVYRLVNSLRSSYEHAFANLGAIRGISYVIFDRNKAIPLERMNAIERGIEIEEWRGFGEDYGRPHKSVEGVLDQGAIAYQGQMIPYESIIGSVYKSMNMDYWQCIPSIYKIIFNYAINSESTLPVSFNDIFPQTSKLDELMGKYLTGDHNITQYMVAAFVIQALVRSSMK